MLAIDDDGDLLRLLAVSLRQAGHGVVTATRGLEGLRLAQQAPPDLVLLDLMLPDTPGTEVCKALKADPRTRPVPVVMLTARADEIDRVVGFELGADDYVTKPFSLRELLLRLRVLLRHGAARPDQEPPGERFVHGLLRVDAGALRAWVDGVEVPLTELESQFLSMLYRHRSRVVSRPMLLRDLWGLTARHNFRNIDTLVKRLRAKLGPAAGCIRTVHGVGYRFAEAEPRGSKHG